MRVELAEKASKKERERVLRTKAEQAAEEDKAKVQRGGGEEKMRPAPLDGTLEGCAEEGGGLGWALTRCPEEYSVAEDPGK
jgi:hypothetical protein